jgi:hypothetical protein
LAVTPWATTLSSTVRHDRFAERRIRRREHCCQQCHLQRAERREYDRGEEEAEYDRQRQADQQQPLREAEVTPDDTEIRVGGIGEQSHGKRQFR